MASFHRELAIPFLARGVVRETRSNKNAFIWSLVLKQPIFICQRECPVRDTTMFASASSGVGFQQSR